MWMALLASLPAFAGPMEGLLLGGGMNGGVLAYPEAGQLGAGFGPGVDLVAGFISTNRDAGFRGGWQLSGGASLRDQRTEWWGEWQGLQLGGLWSVRGSTYHTVTVGGGAGIHSAMRDIHPLFFRADYALGIRTGELNMVEVGPYAALYPIGMESAQVGLKLQALWVVPGGKGKHTPRSVAVPAVPAITLPNLPAIELQCEYFGYQVPVEWLPACEEVKRRKRADRERSTFVDAPSDTDGGPLVDAPSDTRERSGLVDTPPERTRSGLVDTPAERRRSGLVDKAPERTRSGPVDGPKTERGGARRGGQGRLVDAPVSDRDGTERRLARDGEPEAGAPARGEGGRTGAVGPKKGVSSPAAGGASRKKVGAAGPKQGERSGPARGGRKGPPAKGGSAPRKPAERGKRRGAGPSGPGLPGGLDDLVDVVDETSGTRKGGKKKAGKRAAGKGNGKPATPGERAGRRGSKAPGPGTKKGAKRKGKKKGEVEPKKRGRPSTPRESQDDRTRSRGARRGG